MKTHRLYILTFLIALTPSVSFAQKSMQDQRRVSCLAELASCRQETIEGLTKSLKLLCENRRSELRCDRLMQGASAAEKKNFFSCDDPGDMCEQFSPNTISRLYSCGAGAGGVLIDAVVGLVHLPAHLWELARKTPDLPSVFQGCQEDFNKKLLLLGSFRPKDMTDASIRAMSCADIKQFVRTKVDTTLAKLNERLRTEIATTGRENLSYYDLELSHAEIQALDYDLGQMGTMGRARCYKPEIAAKVSCGELTKAGLMATGGIAAVKLVRNFAKPETLALTTEPVSILWYPKAGYRYITHVEWKVGDSVYNSFLGLQRSGRATAIEHRAATGGKGYFEFSLKVTKEELAKLKKYIESNENKLSKDTCISGACAGLRTAGIMDLPPVVRHIPSVAAVYLTAAKQLGYSRVTSIRFVGQDAIGTLIAPQAALELAAGTVVGGVVGGAVGYGVLEGLDGAGNAITHIFPIEEAEKK